MKRVHFIVRMLSLGVIACVLILAIYLPVLAFQNEPKEFRGIRWGSSAASEKDLIHYNKYDYSDIYRRSNDKMQIGDVAGIKNINYFFFKDKLYKVTINFLNGKDGFKNWNQLADVFDNLYGKPWREKNDSGTLYSSNPVDMAISWRGNSTNIDMRYLMWSPSRHAEYPDGCDRDSDGSTATVFCVAYLYKPVATELTQYKKEQMRLKAIKERAQYQKN